MVGILYLSERIEILRACGYHIKFVSPFRGISQISYIKKGDNWQHLGRDIYSLEIDARDVADLITNYSNQNYK